MKKSFIPRTGKEPELAHLWLDIGTIADVEISSEDPNHPFENSLKDEASAWRASTPGPQLVRLVFHEPQQIRRIHLEFYEPALERAQEFKLLVRFSDGSEKELVRQQWSFSPNGSTAEVEDYNVELHQVAAMELQIDPGRHEKQHVASLRSIAIA